MTDSLADLRQPMLVAGSSDPLEVMLWLYALMVAALETVPPLQLIVPQLDRWPAGYRPRVRS